MAEADRGRAAFLARVRESLARGAGSAEEVAPRAPQTAPSRTARAADETAASASRGALVRTFAEAAEAADAFVHRAASVAEARARVLELLREEGAGRVVCDATEALAALGLPAALAASGVEVESAAPPWEPSALRDAAARADAGVTSADYAIAESGTLVLLHGEAHPRSLSVLPPLHVAVVSVERVLPDLSACLARLDAERRELPAVTFVTGPSRTADIEMRITRGVHGPAALHVVLLEPMS